MRVASDRRELTAVEFKSNAIYHASLEKQSLRSQEKMSPPERACITYNGQPRSFSDGIEALPMNRTHELFDWR